MRTFLFIALLVGFGMNLRAQIRQVEYGWDTDKGFGKNTLTAVNTTGNDADINLTVPMQGLSNGYHLLFVRTRDAKGKWSHTQYRLVNMKAGKVPAKIVKVDYLYTQASKTVGQYSYLLPTPATTVQLTIPGNVSQLVAGQSYLISIWATDENGTRSQVHQQGFTYKAIDCKGLAVTIQGADAFCKGGNAPTLIAAVTGGNAPVTVVWTRAGVEVGRGNTLIVSQGGTYIARVTDALGCVVSSTKILAESLAPPVPSISASVPAIVTGGLATLTASVVPGLALQWLLNDVPIAGATQPTYTTTHAGSYAIMVTNINGCSAKSAVFSLGLITALGEPLFEPTGEVLIYPNPSTGLFNINLPSHLNTASPISLTVYELNGRILYDRRINSSQSNTIDLSAYPSGIYLVTIVTGDRGFHVQLIRQ